MKRLLKYIGITLLAVICIDVALRPAFNHLFANPPASVRSTMTHRFHPEQSDVLILGASRASRHACSALGCSSSARSRTPCRWLIATR